MPICKAVTKKGTQCKLPCSRGQITCWIHRSGEVDTRSLLLGLGEQLETSNRTLEKIEKHLVLAYEKPPNTWHAVIHRKAQAILKYVGLPALIVASIVPITDLVQSYRKNALSEILISTYTEYSNNLLQEGESIRAANVLKDFKSDRKFDPVLHYAKAKAFAAAAILNSDEIVNAEDTIRILILLNENSTWITGDFSSEGDSIRLLLMLVEIDLALSRYQKAHSRLGDISKEEFGYHDDIYLQYHLLSATLDVYQYRLSEAEKHLAHVLERSSGKDEYTPYTAEAKFQLAKVKQFESKIEKAISAYKDAVNLFQHTNNERGLARSHNNIGMSYFLLEDYEKASRHFNLSEELSRKLRDDLGLGRALLNRATIESNRGNLNKALELHLEALAALEKTENVNAIAHSQGNIGRRYFDKGEYDKALYYTKNALSSFIRIQEIQRVAIQAGNLADIYKSMRNEAQFTIYDYVAAIFRKAGNDTEWKRNLRLLVHQQQRYSPIEFKNLISEAKSLATDIANEMGRSDIDVAEIENILLHPGKL